MATTYLALLVDGPRDQKVKKISSAAFHAGYTTCSGQTYIKTNTFLRGSGEWVFEYQAGAATGSAGDSGVAPKTHQGWNRLRHSFNQVMPTAIRESRANTSKAFRTLAKLPKTR